MIMAFHVCVGATLLALIITGIYYAYQYFSVPDTITFQIFINPHNVISETEEKFLSVSLDTSFMGCLFHQLNEGEWKKLEDLSKLLSPAYLRLGGTLADKTIFTLNGNSDSKRNVQCGDIKPNESIIITAEDWRKINKFAQNAGFSFIMDLNVLLRTNSGWDSSNAETLVKFSEENGFQLDFQLGNEPNSFRHVFNVDISGFQLAKDFYTLKKILKSTKTYQKSKLIGPDVTRPKNLEEDSVKYLKDFLKKDVVDVVSWHQYYLNGRTATLEDFINPKTYDLLPVQIESVARVVKEISPNLPIWLTETSSAYGGGAPKLSNRYASSLLWVDKLGVAAKSGIRVVIRQSLFKDHYALITDVFQPTPDFWISLLYKKLVGTQVLELNSGDDIRLYAHCLANDAGVDGNVVVYGLNLKNSTELLEVSGVKIKSPIQAYIFQPEFNNLRAKSVLLNDNLLIYNETEVPDLVKMSDEVNLPLIFRSQAIGFWVFEAEETVCGA